MDSLTAEILEWDLSHLSLQQIEHLHALKNQIQKTILVEYIERKRGT